MTTAIPAGAQSYTSNLQMDKSGEGKVTITESKDIDDLVNSTNVANQDEPAQKTVIRQQQQTSKKPAANTHSSVAQRKEEPVREERHTVAETSRSIISEERTREERPVQRESSEVRTRNEKPVQRAERPVQRERSEETTSIDTRKKVNRGWRKVKGYRVQAYSGGNTRQARQAAEQAGNAIKARFPEQPVYVHFYSPSWKCRVGNFRNYNDAARLMRQIRSMGYKSACVVAGTITVQPE